MLKKIVLVSLIISVFILSTGCNIKIDKNGFEFNGQEFSLEDSNVEVVDMIKDEYHEDKEGVNNFNLNLEVGVSNLVIDSESNNLIDSEFNYNVERLKPEYKAKQDGDTKEVTIKQPKKLFNNNNKIKNHYNISLGQDVPTNIDADLGVGKTEMNLSKVDLKNLNIEMGVGDLDLDVNGEYDNELDFDIICGVGKFNADLSGTFNKDVTIDIECGVGSSEIVIPKDVGVKIKVDKGLGGLSVDGLIVSNEDGNKIYKNSLYDNADVKVEINIETGIGSVHIK